MIELRHNPTVMKQLADGGKIEKLGVLCDGRNQIMYGMEGMGWGMGLFGLLVLVFLVLGIAALVKYLSSDRK